MSTDDAEPSAVQSFEEKWKEFQDAFKRMNQALVNNLARQMGVTVESDGNELSDEDRKVPFRGNTPSVDAFWAMVKDGTVKRIVVCCGAGLSTSAGIPDFRSPDTGIYAKMQRERDAAAAETSKTEDGDAIASDDLPETPEEMFSAAYFTKNPKPMSSRCAEMWPTSRVVNGVSRLSSKYRPAPAHAFLALLHEMGVLLRVFTQNIDGLELDAGLPDELVVRAHGDMRSARCHICGATFEGEEFVKLLPQLQSGAPVRCPACCVHHVRPRIVMYGEAMPREFSERANVDLKACDAVVVLGTSLLVRPFANLPSEASTLVPRLLMNREPAGVFRDAPKAFRDVMALGDLTALCTAAAASLGKRRRFTDLCRSLECKEQPAAAPRPSRAKAQAAPVSRRTSSISVTAPRSRSMSGVATRRAPSTRTVSRKR